MTFSLLAPAALAAGVSLIVIYALHIRRQTPPPRRVPSLRFWDAADASVTDRQRFQLPPVTVALLLQLLIAALVTLALARPALSGSLAAIGDRSEPGHTIVIIDGSTSMLGRVPNDDGTRWDAAKSNALATLDDWTTGDVVTILVAAHDVSSRSASNESQRDDMRTWLRDLAAPGGRPAIDRAIEIAGNLRLPDRRNAIRLLTDGAIFPAAAVARSVGMPIELATFADEGVTANAAITSIGARQIPGSTRQYAIAFQVTNFAPTASDIPWTTTADSERIAANTLFLGPGESRLVTVNLPVDARAATVSLGFDDALDADNTASIFVGATEAGSRRILLLSDAPSALLRALQAIPGASVQVYSPSTPGLTGLASGFDLLVTEGYMPPEAERPSLPSLFVQPSANGSDVTITGALTDPTLTYVDSQAPELADVDLSGVTWGAVPTYQFADDEVTTVALVTSGTQQAPLIWRGEWNERPWIATAFAVSETNIATRVAFPILVSRMVESLMQATVPQAITVGTPLDIPTSEDISTIAVTMPDGVVSQFDTAPGGGTFAATGRPGTYAIDLLRSDGSVRSSFQVTANAGDPIESDLTLNPNLRSVVALAESTSASETSSAASPGELWRLVTLALLAILLMEWFVSNRSLWGKRTRGATA